MFKKFSAVFFLFKYYNASAHVSTDDYNDESIRESLKRLMASSVYNVYHIGIFVNI